MDIKRDSDQFYPGTDNVNYVKSNILVGAKFKSPLLENKLMAVALSHIPDAKVDKEGSLIVEMRSTELKKRLKLTGGSFYKRLDSTAKAMTGRTIGISDPENNYFRYVAVITQAEYSNGLLTVEFNKHMRQYLTDIKSNFTRLSLETMLMFESVYSFRLYEVLKSRAYTLKGAPKVDVHHLEFNLSELKLELGIVNANLDKVKKILDDSPAPDFDKAVAASPEKLLKDWTDFRRYCLDVAVNEINSIKETEMNVSYDPVRSGRGGKVVGIIFHVEVRDRNKAEENVLTENEIIEKTELSEDEKADFYDLIIDLIEEKIKVKDAKAIADAANYNMNVIMDKYGLSKKNDIDNIVGWMIDAIKNDYKASPSKKSSNKTKASSKSGRKYNYKELEEELLDD